MLQEMYKVTYHVFDCYNQQKQKCPHPLNDPNNVFAPLSPSPLRKMTKLWAIMRGLPPPSPLCRSWQSRHVAPSIPLSPDSIPVEARIPFRTVDSILLALPLSQKQERHPGLWISCKF